MSNYVGHIVASKDPSRICVFFFGPRPSEHGTIDVTADAAREQLIQILPEAGEVWANAQPGNEAVRTGLSITKETFERLANFDLLSTGS